MMKKLSRSASGFMSIHIVDTTLRDGEQQAGMALGTKEKVRIARLLDHMGVYQIEAGIPAMGGMEKESIATIVGLRLSSKISAWNRLNIGDIDHSIDCGVQMIHITAPSSDIQITKMQKDRAWVIENLKECILHARVHGSEVSVGLEDASRADFAFLLQLISTASREGAERVRYADTVGILHPRRIFAEIREIRNHTDIDIEIHAHNDLGMAVANSISAVQAGAKYVDCTIGGIGERAGNCNYQQFIRANTDYLDRNNVS